MAAPRSDTEQPIRLLYADDHPAVRSALRSLLARITDIELVGEAEDGEMAVAMSRLLRPDLVMLDVDMPRLSGPEAAKAIKAQLPETRILYFTGDRQLTASGLCDGLVYKTDPVSELLARIRHVARAEGAGVAVAIPAGQDEVGRPDEYPQFAVATTAEMSRASNGERTPLRFRGAASGSVGRSRMSESIGRVSEGAAIRAASSYADLRRGPEGEQADMAPIRGQFSHAEVAPGPAEGGSRRRGERIQAVHLADGGMAIEGGSRLTPRQVQVLKYVAAGYTNLRTAEELGISAHTVKKHVHALLRLTGATNRAALASWWTEVSLSTTEAD